MTTASEQDHEAAVAIAKAFSDGSATAEQLSPAFHEAVTQLDLIQDPKLFVAASNFISAKAKALGFPDPLRATVNEPLLTRKAAALSALWWEQHAAGWALSTERV